MDVLSPPPLTRPLFIDRRIKLSTTIEFSVSSILFSSVSMAQSRDNMRLMLYRNSTKCLCVFCLFDRKLKYYNLIEKISRSEQLGKLIINNEYVFRIFIKVFSR